MTDNELKAFITKTFDTVADNYDTGALRFFPDSAANALTLLNLQGNEHVLDVGTGTGWDSPSC